MTFARIVGGVLIIIGLLNIFAKDFVWELTAFGNRLEGERSERTGTWNVGSTFTGIALIGVGIFLLSNGQAAPVNEPNIIIEVAE